MKLIFDIGCAGGEWLKTNFDRGATFVGVEPNKGVFKESKERFRFNNNVILYNSLLANKNGVYDFHFHYNISTCSNRWMTDSRHSGADYGVPIKTKATTLDKLIEVHGKPDYIKIDVEGFEYEVLSGLTQKVGMIAFEFVEEIPDLAYKCMEYLHNLGYEQWNWRHGDDYDYIPPDWIDYDSLVDTFKNLFITERQQCWGMIFCK